MGVRSSKITEQNNRSEGHLLEYFRNTFIRGGGGTNAPIPPSSGLTATGGVISDYTDPGPGTIYRAHIFTSSGTFDVTELGGYGDTVDLLVVAGGGGGGGGNFPGNAGGGGGAGGLRYVPNLSVGTYTYPVDVGAGGVAARSTALGTNGGNSVFNAPNGNSIPAITATGGGAGGVGYFPYTQHAQPGGSGGGRGTPSGEGTGNAGGNEPRANPVSEGNDGGGGSYGAGGGGAGGAGVDNSGGDGSAGGPGLQFLLAGPPATTQPIGTPGPNPGGGYFAGGGGGGGQSGAGGGPGSPGGGGAGGAGSGSPAAVAGTYATGGGGGSGGENPANNGGAHGGSGIVVVRYQIGQLTAEAKATGGAISYYNGKTIHTFTNSGAFTTPASFNETVEYFVVGSGAGGGNFAGGGGGAGGIRNGTTPLAGPISYPVVIGAGGRGTTSESDNGGDGLPGNSSSFGPISVGGGGGGGSYNNPRAGIPGPVSGGSGGGGGSDGGGSWSGGTSSGTQHPGSYPFTGSSPTTGWGTAGGDHSSYPGSAGGGGAGQAGFGPPAKGGYGMQAPVTFQDPASGVGDLAPGAPSPGGKWFGGGGDGWRNVAPVPTTNPYGGGGYFLPNGGTPGLENTGGGGAAGNGSSSPSGSGGSGIVLIAYPS